MTDLTPREMDVLRLARQGHSDREIAHRLGIAPATAKSHVKSALRKLGASSRTQAVADCVAAGLLA